MSLKSDIKRISVKKEEKVHCITKGKMCSLRIKKKTTSALCSLGHGVGRP